MTSSRCCSRSSCPEPAVATLTYVYATSTAVVGPLAARAEPHAYDLCAGHARRLTIPRGWQLVRHDGEFEPPPPVPDDLVALAEAVRETSPPAPRESYSATAVRPRPRPRPDSAGGRRGGHLRIVQPPV